MSISNIKNCGDENQVIKVAENSTLTITDDCEVFTNVCANVNAYDQAIVSQNFYLNEMLLIFL